MPQARPGSGLRDCQQLPSSPPRLCPLCPAQSSSTVVSFLQVQETWPPAALKPCLLGIQEKGALSCGVQRSSLTGDSRFQLEPRVHPWISAEPEVQLGGHVGGHQGRPSLKSPLKPWDWCREKAGSPRDALGRRQPNAQ